MDILFWSIKTCVKRAKERSLDVELEKRTKPGDTDPKDTKTVKHKEELYLDFMSELCDRYILTKLAN